MWAYLLTLLVAASPSLTLEVERRSDGASADTILFLAAPNDTLVLSPQRLKLTVDPPKGAWRLLLHTANDSIGRGLRNHQDASLGTDLFWRPSRISDGNQHDSWRLLRDPSEPEWRELASSSSSEVMVDSGVEHDARRSSRMRMLEFAALIDRIPAGTYNTRILVDLLCFSEPDDDDSDDDDSSDDDKGWVKIHSQGKGDKKSRRVHGDAVSLFAGYRKDILSVRFEYRPATPLPSQTPWTLCATTLWSDQNPDTNPPRWAILWDIASLADGRYDLRAIATLLDGRADPDPQIILVEKSSTDSRWHGFKDERGDRFTERLWCGSDDGETLALFDGTIIRIPPGSWGKFDTQTWLRVSLIDHPPSGAALGSRFIAPNRAFRRFEREDGRHKFAERLTIEIPYTLDGFPTSPEHLGLYWFDEVTRAWTPLPDSQVDTQRKVVIGRTDHFSDFAVLARAAAIEPQKVIVYPNPYVPYDQRQENGSAFIDGDLTTGIIFDGLTPGDAIRICSITGKEITKLSEVRFDGRIHWNARSFDGSELASGTYLALIRTLTGQTALKKFMIIR